MHRYPYVANSWIVSPLVIWICCNSPKLLHRPKVQKARSMTWTTDIMTDLSSSLEEARRLLFIISITLRTIDRQSNAIGGSRAMYFVMWQHETLVSLYGACYCRRSLKQIKKCSPRSNYQVKLIGYILWSFSNRRREKAVVQGLKQARCDHAMLS
jgi:hypothetical protein